MRFRWLLAGALALIAAAVLVAIVISTDDSSEPASESAEARPSAQEPDESAALANSGAASGCADLAHPGGEDDQGLEIDAIKANVESLRELRFRGEPEVKLLPVEELDERLKREMRRQYRPADAADEERALKLLAAIPADADLYRLRTTGLEGQVAGLYLPRTQELLVAEGENPGALERAALAHELEHALADERLGIPLPQRADPARADSLLARQALIEGDATLLTELYIVRHVGLSDLLDLGGSASLTESGEDLARLPYHLQRELLWPYADGSRFACALYRRGGWTAVDRAYGRPPASSDQVLFPARYGSGPAGLAPQPGRLPAPWKLRERAELGAAQLMWLFEAPAGDPERALPDPRASAAAWAGGRFALWSGGPADDASGGPADDASGGPADDAESKSALGIALRERTAVPVLCAAVAGWYSAAHPDDRRVGPRPGERLAIDGPSQDAVLRCPEGEVRLGIAPDLATARRLADAP